jgi:hypothetical protein
LLGKKKLARASLLIRLHQLTCSSIFNKLGFVLLTTLSADLHDEADMTPSNHATSEVINLAAAGLDLGQTDDALLTSITMAWTLWGHYLSMNSCGQSSSNQELFPFMSGLRTTGNLFPVQLNMLVTTR